MGQIKKQLMEKNHDHTLTEEEFNYVMNINQAKSNIADEYNRVISAFLKYIACSRLGYPADQDLQFELDFSDKEHKLKVTPVED